MSHRAAWLAFALATIVIIISFLKIPIHRLSNNTVPYIVRMFLFPHSFATRNPAFFIDTRNSIIESKDAVAQQKSQVAANIGNEAAESISVVLFPDSDSASSIEQLDFHIVVQVPIPPRPRSPTLGGMYI